MVQRIVKLMGRAYTTGSAVTAQVSYNGAEVINTGVTASTVTAMPFAAEVTDIEIELAIFETTTDITGQIPVTITVNGGTLFFAHFWMNYSGYTPETPPEFYYGDPNVNTVESDGVSNLTKNGSPWVWRENVGDLLGDWMYPVAAGETIAFDFFVDPAKVILVVPT